MMTDKVIRIFNVVKGREEDINFAIICDGRTHFVCRGGLNVPHRAYMENELCDGKGCQGQDSDELNISLLSIESQEHLYLVDHVPPGLVLVTKRSGDFNSPYRSRVYSSGAAVTPKQLEIGTLLADGEGATYFKDEYGLIAAGHRYVYYVRNEGGKPEVSRVGREDRKRTATKLAKLRRGERKSEVYYEVTLLNERLLELMQLHRTPEVLEEIEKVKELLRLAASLSAEASIEAAEGSEQIARELANSRAREIGAELRQTRERLMLEKQVREEVRKELNDQYDN